MRMFGAIHKVHLGQRMIALKTYQRVTYFYFQSGQFNQFKRYLFSGVYIDLEYNEDKIFIKKGISAYPIDYVNQIFQKTAHRNVVFYDQTMLHNSLSQFLASLGNKMFLDLEMTMPPYGFTGKEFVAEMIQAGYLLVDANGEEISRYSNYIRPALHPNLSKRTLKFLNIEEEAFRSKAIPYRDFYEDFKEILELYHPTIIIYGKNDSLILKQSFYLNNVPSLMQEIRFVNLCKLVKDYYNLKNDPGLFKLFQIYYENEDIQIHDAFNDCYVTKEVFLAFQKDVARYTHFKDKIKSILEPK